MDGEMDDQQDEGAVARKRAGLLEDATELARQLEVILEQANAREQTGFHKTLTQIEAAAADAAAKALGASGQVREKYYHDRRGGRPVLHLFVDESGQADAVQEFNEDNKFFTLGAIAISGHAHKQYQADADQLKREFFKDGTDVVLHASQLRDDMKHPPEWKGEFALNAGKSWSGLARALKRLVEETEFTAFGVIIQREVFHQEFTETGEDPFLPRETYDLALHLLLERFTSFLASEAGAPIGSITLESQNPPQDARHQLSIARTIAHGTRWVSDHPLQRDIRPGVEFLKKQPSHPLELSDMLANFLYRLAKGGFLDGRPPYLRRGDGLWDIFCRKFYQKGNLRKGQFGLKVFPAGDLNAWLNDFREKHRRKA